MGGGGEQPKSTKVTKQVLLFFKFILSFFVKVGASPNHAWKCPPVAAEVLGTGPH